MTVIACPYCGAMMNLPLRFCVSCGRPTTTAGKFGGLKVITRGGATKRLDDSGSGQSFDRSKKSYRFQRLMRQILLNTSYVLIAVLLYYFTAQFVLKEFPAGLESLKHKEQPPAAAGQ